MVRMDPSVKVSSCLCYNFRRRRHHLRVHVQKAVSAKFCSKMTSGCWASPTRSNKESEVETMHTRLQSTELSTQFTKSMYYAVEVMSKNHTTSLPDVAHSSGYQSTSKVLRSNTFSHSLICNHSSSAKVLARRLIGTCA